MNLIRKLAVVIVALGSLSVAQADPVGFGLKFEGHGTALWQINFAAGTSERIGLVSEEEVFGGIAIDSQGKLFAATHFGELFEVSAADASSVFIGNISSGPSSGTFLRGLDFFGDTLFGIDDRTSPNVFEIDVITAERAEVVTAHAFLGNTISFAMQSESTALIYSNFWNFYSLDLISGDASIISNSVFPSHGIDFAHDNILYGVRHGRSGLFEIDPTSGASSLVSSGVGEGWLALTAQGVTSVPEPGTLALLGIGLFGMGLSRRRKKV